MLLLPILKTSRLPAFNRHHGLSRILSRRNFTPLYRSLVRKRSTLNENIVALCINTEGPSCTFKLIPVHIYLNPLVVSLAIWQTPSNLRSVLWTKLTIISIIFLVFPSAIPSDLLETTRSHAIGLKVLPI